MEFEDLLTDIDLECPHCNRKFQQKTKELKGGASAECPTCGEAIEVKEQAPARDPKDG